MAGLELGGRNAVITGAGSGIGRALALTAAERGMTVALADITEDGVNETLSMVEANGGGGGIARKLDIRDAEAFGIFADEVFETYGAPAAVFANAGVLNYGSTLRPDLAIWQRSVDINIMGTVNTVHAFLGRMLDAGESAQFVITGSMGSFVSAPELASYTAVKHAVWAIADSLEMELASQDAIKVSMLCPPRVDTPLLRESEERTRAASGDEAAKELRGGAMTPEAIAQAAFAGITTRQFYIAPQIESIEPLLTKRISRLLESG